MPDAETAPARPASAGPETVDIDAIAVPIRPACERPRTPRPGYGRRAVRRRGRPVRGRGGERRRGRATATRSTTRLITRSATWCLRARSARPGAAVRGRVRVESHRADDPIVLPGHAGDAHLHDFFGNTTTAADSTHASLRGRDYVRAEARHRCVLGPGVVRPRRVGPTDGQRRVLPAGAGRRSTRSSPSLRASARSAGTPMPSAATAVLGGVALRGIAAPHERSAVVSDPHDAHRPCRVPRLLGRSRCRQCRSSESRRDERARRVSCEPSGGDPAADLRCPLPDPRWGPRFDARVRRPAHPPRRLRERVGSGGTRTRGARVPQPRQRLRRRLESGHRLSRACAQVEMSCRASRRSAARRQRRRARG